MSTEQLVRAIENLPPEDFQQIAAAVHAREEQLDSQEAARRFNEMDRDPSVSRTHSQVFEQARKRFG